MRTNASASRPSPAALPVVGQLIGGVLVEADVAGIEAPASAHG